MVALRCTKPAGRRNELKTVAVVITRKLPDATEKRMAELFSVTTNPTDEPLSRKQLEEAVATADVLVPTVTDTIDADLISKAGPKLKLIANFGNGTDNIDVKAAAAKGIKVSNTPKVLTEDTADMTMALILAVPRRLVEGAEIIHQSKGWAGWSPSWMLGNRIFGKRLGIIGMGRIGTAVARRAKAFGLSVHYHNRDRVMSQLEDELSATYWNSLDAMLPEVDIVCIHCPSTAATRALLSKERIALMRKGAYVINTSRGGILDEDALIKALETGHLGGAGLDVFAHEPSVDPRLQALAEKGKVIMLPHMGSATVEGRIEMGEKVMINIRTVMDGHRPPDWVLPTDG